MQQALIYSVTVAFLSFPALGDENTSRIPSNVSEGSDLFNRYPAVGMLVRPESANNLAKTECTGALIGHTVFLTAAHCIFDSSTLPKDISRWRIYLPHSGLFKIDSGPDGMAMLKSFEVLGRCRRVSSEIGHVVCIHPNHKTRTEIEKHPKRTIWGDDIAVLKIAEPVRGIVPATIANKLRNDAPHFVGYGQTGDTSFNQGILRHRVGKFASCPGRVRDLPRVDSDVIRMDQEVSPVVNLCLEFERKEIVDGKTTHLSSICRYNSGGPLFFTSEDGKMAIVGVLSGGFWYSNACEITAHPPNRPLAVFTKVPETGYALWLQSVVQAFEIVPRTTVAEVKTIDSGIVYGLDSVKSIRIPSAALGSRISIAANAEHSWRDPRSIRLKVMGQTDSGNVPIKCLSEGIAGAIVFCDFIADRFASYSISLSVEIINSPNENPDLGPTNNRRTLQYVIRRWPPPNTSG